MKNTKYGSFYDNRNLDTLNQKDLINMFFNQNSTDINYARAEQYIVTVESDGIYLLCTSINVPSISISSAAYPTPQVDIPEMGARVDFGTVSIDIIIDTSFKTYQYLYSWLMLGANGEYVRQRKNFEDIPYEKTIFIHTLDNHNSLECQPKISLTNCVPIGLSELNFDSQNTGYMSVTLTLEPMFVDLIFPENNQ